MRVLIDCSQISRQKAGVGIYALNLIKEIGKRKGNNTKFWLIVQDDDADFAQLADSFSLVRIPARLFRFLPLRLLMEQLYIPWIARRHKIDVLHSLHYSLPLLPMRAQKIVTVHDLTSYIMPEVHTKTRLLYFRFFIRAASRLANALIFVSQATSRDWNRYFPEFKGQCHVIPLGKSPKYRPDLEPREMEAAVHKYRLTKPYLLYIGTIEPRKNLTRLVEAFSRISEAFPTHQLVIAGMKGWMYEELFATIKTLKIDNKVVFTGFIDESDKPYLIGAAEAFIYPSLYEGFGIPVLEALACGTPTLTSNCSSLPEVAGDAALLADPTDIDDLASNIERLLADTELRNLLRENSLKQAALFDWAYTADQTLCAYRSLAR